MKKQYRIGIVGCGGISRWGHGPFYAENKDRVKVVAVCDILPDRVESFRKEFHPEAETYTDWRELLKRDDLDAVDICTPNDLHAEIAIAALGRGLNVFCEKPDAVSADRAAAMAEAAEKSGKLLMVMRNNRFSPLSTYLKKFIEDGRMGEIYAGRACWQRRRGIPGKGGWFTTKARSGGGPLIDLGVHMIDLAIWLMGNPKPVAVSGTTYCKFANAETSDSVNSQFGDAVDAGTFDVEDLAMGFIRFDNGACLQIEFSWASNVQKEHRFVELRGTKAGATWTDGYLMDIFSEDAGQLPDTHFDISTWPTNKLGGHYINLNNFFDVLDGAAKPCYLPEQGVDMIRILDAMYESARSGHEVAL